MQDAHSVDGRESECLEFVELPLHQSLTSRVDQTHLLDLTPRTRACVLRGMANTRDLGFSVSDFSGTLNPTPQALSSKPKTRIPGAGMNRSLHALQTMYSPP